MSYAVIDDARVWFDEYGVGVPVVLLHGGLCTNATWMAQTSEFAAHFRVIAPERRGHGHTPDIEGAMSYDLMATDTIAFLSAHVHDPVHLVGWSDGGIVSLLVALQRPDLVRKLVVIGTNYDVAGLVPEAAAYFASMDPSSDDLATLRTAYEETSPDGPGHWPVVVAKFKEMVIAQPSISLEQLSRIKSPTLIVTGDDDLVTLEHTVSLLRAIPDAELAVVPGASHFVAMEKPELFNRLVIDFLEKDPVETFMPLARKPETAHDR